MQAEQRGEYNVQQIFLLAILLLLILVLSCSSEFFLTWKNWRNIIDHMSTQMLLALGMTFVIATGGLDLSVGGIIALCGVGMGMALNAGCPTGTAIAIGTALSLLLGWINGMLARSVDLHPFILTLGTALVFRGAAIILTGGTPIYGIPADFAFWGRGLASGLTPSIILSAAALIWAAFALNFTRWGLYAMSMGSSEEALKRQGVAVGRYKVSYYMVSGLMAGLSALIITARLRTAEPTAGTGMELDAITAVIMGGTLMQGGKAFIGGTAVACLLLAVIKNALTILSINSYYQQFIIGILLLVSVIVAERRQKAGKKESCS